MVDLPITQRWQKERGARLVSSRPLDSAKLQAPGVIRTPAGQFRLFYTAVGPAKPFASCQGYILSAISDDGLEFRKEPGIRLAPQPMLAHNSLRVLAPTISQRAPDQWRMYFESRGPANHPPVICSAISDDMLHWELEEGIRFQQPGGVGGPRFVTLPDGRGRLYCTGTEVDAGGQSLSQGVISAVTTDGLHFEIEPDYRRKAWQFEYDSAGITAADVILPQAANGKWFMVYSAWQDVPPGTVVPLHPSADVNAVFNGLSETFAAASIASDMAGYRSRIYIARSDDGLHWGPGECIVAGGGFTAADLDAVHAEDMSLTRLSDGRYRMYYAACDKDGNWQIVSAVTEGVLA